MTEYWCATFFCIIISNFLKKSDKSYKKDFLLNIRAFLQKIVKSSTEKSRDFKF